LVSEHPIEWDDAKVSRLWDYYSRNRPFRDEYFAKIYGGFALRRAGLSRTAKLRVLDFGCGPGHIWDHIRRRGVPWRYTGLDFSADSVAALQRRAAGETGFEGAVVASGLPCSLPSGHFDAVLLFEVVEHLTDDRLEGTIQEIRRLLKPGGLLVVTTPNAEDMALDTRFCPECGAVFHQWQHVRTWTPEGLSSRLSQRGLIHERTWVGHWDDHHVPGWLFNRAAKVWLHRRIDIHMLAVFRSSGTNDGVAQR
jgi:SAM-dependent methyltransferase